MEVFQALAGRGQFFVCGSITGGYEDAVETAFAGVTVEFAGDVFGNFAGSDG